MPYVHHRIVTLPQRWKHVASDLVERSADLSAHGALLFGVWRSQIGRPRDELTAITHWPDGSSEPDTALGQLLGDLGEVRSVTSRPMTATLRPRAPTPPRRQGNYAFRHFETPAANWPEFLSLCELAWPGFESSYDSQVIGLWRFHPNGQGTSEGGVQSLLLTRRPDLAMWERSKLPQGELEESVRRKLNRRYELCDFTVVYTSTLLTATDRDDEARWT